MTSRPVVLGAFVIAATFIQHVTAGGAESFPAGIPIGRAVAWSNSAAGSIPSTLTAEKLESIRRRALANPNTARITSEVTSLLGIPTEAILAKQLLHEYPDGRKYYINFSLQPNTDDILFVVMKPGITNIYLTDSSRELRAAILVDASGGRLITRAAAADGYEETLRDWAEWKISPNR